MSPGNQSSCQSLAYSGTPSWYSAIRQIRDSNSHFGGARLSSAAAYPLARVGRLNNWGLLRLGTAAPRAKMRIAVIGGLLASG